MRARECAGMCIIENRPVPCSGKRMVDDLHKCFLELVEGRAPDINKDISTEGALCAACRDVFLAVYLDPVKDLLIASGQVVLVPLSAPGVPN